MCRVLLLLAVLLTSAAAPATAAPTTEIRQLLLRLNLGRYTDAFEAAGYDDADFLMHLSAAGLQQVAHVVDMKPGHAHKFELRMNHLLKLDLAAPSGGRRHATMPQITPAVVGAPPVRSAGAQASPTRAG